MDEETSHKTTKGKGLEDIKLMTPMSLKDNKLNSGGSLDPKFKFSHFLGWSKWT
jgi:hypothetical protein